MRTSKAPPSCWAPPTSLISSIGSLNGAPAPAPPAASSTRQEAAPPGPGEAAGGRTFGLIADKSANPAAGSRVDDKRAAIQEPRGGMFERRWIAGFLLALLFAPLVMSGAALAADYKVEMTKVDDATL